MSKGTYNSHFYREVLTPSRGALSPNYYFYVLKGLVSKFINKKLENTEIILVICTFI